MCICLDCKSYKKCKESGYDLEFLKSVMISLASSSLETIRVTHQYSADKLGYNLEEVIDFIEETKENCIIYSRLTFRNSR